MLPTLSNRSKSSVAKRCTNDEATKLRLKYDPYYHTIDKQEGSHVWVEGKEMILLTSNDYLGLSTHPKVIEASKKALDEWGTSTTGARLANGSRSYHCRLEEKIATFLGKEDCFVTTAGYLSCMGAIQGLAQKDDLVLIDKNVHSSLWAGIALSHARSERFAHNNCEDLKEVLSYEKSNAHTFLVFEGVYSMEGHIAPIPQLLETTKDCDCFYIIDDAHGFGVLGDQGRGTANHFGVNDEMNLIVGSLSKSLSSTGGFAAGDKDVIEYLRTHSKQMIFSAAISPVQAAAAEASLEILQSEPEHLERLWGNTRRYKQILDDLKLDTWNSDTPAIPIVLGTKERAYRFWKLLMENGLFTIMSIAPAVPPKKDLVRTAISARHTDDDLDKIGEILTDVIKRM